MKCSRCKDSGEMARIIPARWRPSIGDKVAWRFCKCDKGWELYKEIFHDPSDRPKPDWWERDK